MDYLTKNIPHTDFHNAGKPLNFDIVVRFLMLDTYLNVFVSVFFFLSVVMITLFTVSKNLAVLVLLRIECRASNMPSNSLPLSCLPKQSFLQSCLTVIKDRLLGIWNLPCQAPVQSFSIFLVVSSTDLPFLVL